MLCEGLHSKLRFRDWVIVLPTLLLGHKSSRVLVSFFLFTGSSRFRGRNGLAGSDDRNEGIVIVGRFAIVSANALCGNVRHSELRAACEHREWVSVG